MMTTLTILGAGEAFDPNIPNTSLLYEGAKNVLLDCGFAAAQAIGDAGSIKIISTRFF